MNKGQKPVLGYAAPSKSMTLDFFFSALHGTLKIIRKQFPKQIR